MPRKTKDKTYRKNHPEIRAKERCSYYNSSPNVAEGRGKSEKRKWTQEEIEKLYDASVSDRELAVEIGRSIAAIQTKRTQYKGFAPQGWKGKASQKAEVSE